MSLKVAFFRLGYLTYIDDLSISLSNANAGFKFGGMSVNNVSYADDMAILSPPASGLQKLLNIFASYAIKPVRVGSLSRFKLTLPQCNVPGVLNCMSVRLSRFPSLY